MPIPSLHLFAPKTPPASHRVAVLAARPAQRHRSASGAGRFGGSAFGGSKQRRDEARGRFEVRLELNVGRPKRARLFLLSLVV